MIGGSGAPRMLSGTASSDYPKGKPWFELPYMCTRSGTGDNSDAQICGRRIWGGVGRVPGQRSGMCYGSSRH